MKVSTGIQALVGSLFNYASLVFLTSVAKPNYSISIYTSLLLLPAAWCLLYESPGPINSSGRGGGAIYLLARVFRVCLIIVLDILIANFRNTN